MLVAGFSLLSMDLYGLDTMVNCKLFLSLALFAFLGLSPVIVTMFLYANRANLDKPKFKERWGELYLNFKYEHFSSLIFYPLFLFRRSIFVLIIIGFYTSS
jgi:hypothetical protein